MEKEYVTEGKGHLIEPKGPTKYSGYRTIMAYIADGHYERVNYYSNPNVDFPRTRKPTGVVGVADNAKVITENRCTFANIGNEKEVCNVGSTGTPETPVTSVVCNVTGTPEEEGI